MMTTPFDTLIDRYLPPAASGANSVEVLTRHLTLVHYDRKHVLVREGQRHDFTYFIVRGGVRSYYLKDGLEVNTWFAFEEDIVGSLYGYQERPSRETIELLEESTLIAINLRTLRPLVHTHIGISRFVGGIVEEYAQFLEDRLYFLQHMSAAERYAHLLAYEPLALQRVPLTYIASYLGVSRETLSRLRGK